MVIYGLFNDALSSTDDVASNGGIIIELCIRRSVGGSGRGLFQGIISVSALGVGKKDKIPSDRIANFFSFLKVYEPPQKFKRQKRDPKQVPY